MNRTRVAQVWKSADRGSPRDPINTCRKSDVRIVPRVQVRWAEKLRPACPYMKRWVLDLGLFSLRVHHWYSSDDDRHFHDHPWPFATLVLKGGYTDVSPAGSDALRAGSVRRRPAEWQHTVKVNPSGCWTVMATGPQLRRWGFWVNGKFKRSNKYFLEHGHHPCK